ncbi:MAG: TlpA family protein disulfide reductase [Gemmatimonadetes bacterium]|nr:TlpA family protein disulfide reductase [Gemmatimonadota bacterium]MYD13365.1 TlpA family protein disulfide reductase [Gemmatimonadota bacterium]MYI66234.1 TlpA family protein disulfide reductase [Gemmatimonadota bacterium]
MVGHRSTTPAGIGLLFAVLPVLSCARDSGLRFSPDDPSAGSEINVEYVASSTLADESELVMRGTYRTAEGLVELLTIPTMQLGSGNTFTTRFTLPETAVYAAFVVEDAAGQHLDTSGGDLFDLLVHDGDGAPLYRGFVGRADEFEDRNMHTSLEALRRALELYPDSLDGWGRLRSLEKRALGSSVGDSLFVWHQDNFAAIDERYRDREDLPLATVEAILDYAGEVGEEAARDHWDTRVDETVGSFSWSQSVALPILRQWQADRNSEAALDAWESYWPTAQEGQIAGFAMQVAIGSKNREATDRWIQRALRRYDDFAIAGMIADWFPEHCERAVEIARADFEQTDAIRPLGRTADEHAQSLVLAQAPLWTDYARLLSRCASAEEALAVVEEATARNASPDLFEALGELNLGEGDIDGAARAYAVVVSDPATPQPKADSLASLVGYAPDSPEWGALLEAARAQVLALVLSQADNWTPAGSHVTDASGERHALADLVAGRPTVLVFWARWCGPCIEKIPDVARLQETLEPLGAQVLSIAWRDPPGADMDAFIVEHGIDYPVYHDLEDSVTDAFGVSAIQTNFVLDAEGRVSFARTELVDIPRQVEALVRQR